MMCCRSETLVYSSLVSKHCSSSSLTQVEKKNSRLVGDRIFSCLNDYWRQLLSELDARHRPMVLESRCTRFLVLRLTACCYNRHCLTVRPTDSSRTSWSRSRWQQVESTQPDAASSLLLVVQ